MKLEKILKFSGAILIGAGIYLLYRLSKKDSAYYFKDGFEGLPFYQIQRIKREQEETPLFI